MADKENNNIEEAFLGTMKSIQDSVIQKEKEFSSRSEEEVRDLVDKIFKEKEEKKKKDEETQKLQDDILALKEELKNLASSSEEKMKKENESIKEKEEELEKAETALVKEANKMQHYAINYSGSSVTRYEEPFYDIKRKFSEAILKGEIGNRGGEILKALSGSPQYQNITSMQNFNNMGLLAQTYMLSEVFGLKQVGVTPLRRAGVYQSVGFGTNSVGWITRDPQEYVDLSTPEGERAKEIDISGTKNTCTLGKSSSLKAITFEIQQAQDLSRMVLEAHYQAIALDQTYHFYLGKNVNCQGIFTSPVISQQSGKNITYSVGSRPTDKDLLDYMITLVDNAVLNGVIGGNSGSSNYALFMSMKDWEKIRMTKSANGDYLYNTVFSSNPLNYKARFEGNPSVIGQEPHSLARLNGICDVYALPDNILQPTDTSSAGGVSMAVVNFDLIGVFMSDLWMGEEIEKKNAIVTSITHQTWGMSPVSKYAITYLLATA